MTRAAESGAQRRWRLVATASWIALIVLCVAWEWRLAPLRPGGSWLILKAVPLLLPLRGMLRAAPRSFQWALLLVLLYLAEATVRVFEPPPYATLAWIELLLVVLFFGAAIGYLRPFKRAAAVGR